MVVLRPSVVNAVAVMLCRRGYTIPLQLRAWRGRGLRPRRSDPLVEWPCPCPATSMSTRFHDAHHVVRWCRRMDDDRQRQPWERRPGETVKAHAAFVEYLRLRYGRRSIDKAWLNQQEGIGKAAPRRRAPMIPGGSGHNGSPGARGSLRRTHARTRRRRPHPRFAATSGAPASSPGSASTRTQSSATHGKPRPLW